MLQRVVNYLGTGLSTKALSAYSFLLFLAASRACKCSVGWSVFGRFFKSWQCRRKRLHFSDGFLQIRPQHIVAATKICVFKHASQEGGGTTSSSGGLFLEPTSDIKIYQNGGWPLHLYKLWRSYSFVFALKGMGMGIFSQVKSIPIHNAVHELLAGKNRGQTHVMWSHEIFDAPLNPGVFCFCGKIWLMLQKSGKTQLIS